MNKDEKFRQQAREIALVTVSEYHRLADEYCGGDKNLYTAMDSTWGKDHLEVLKTAALLYLAANTKTED